MLKFEWRRVAPRSSQRSTTFEPPARPEASVADANPDLAIRDLLDDPRLRACLEAPVTAHGVVADDAIATLPTRVRGTSMSAVLREGVARAAA